MSTGVEEGLFLSPTSPFCRRGSDPGKGRRFPKVLVRVRPRAAPPGSLTRHVEWLTLMAGILLSLGFFQSGIRWS